MFPIKSGVWGFLYHPQPSFNLNKWCWEAGKLYAFLTRCLWGDVFAGCKYIHFAGTLPETVSVGRYVCEGQVGTQGFVTGFKMSHSLLMASSNLKTYRSCVPFCWRWMFPQVVKPQISKQRYSNTRRLGTSFFWTHPISSTKVNERGWNAQGKTRRRATLVLPVRVTGRWKYTHGVYM